MKSCVISAIIGLNVLIALYGFYVAWRIWLFKRTLVKVVAAILSWERQTHRALDPARTPNLILHGQKVTTSLRARYTRLESQLKQLYRITSIALVGLQLLQSPGRRRKPLRFR